MRILIAEDEKSFTTPWNMSLKSMPRPAHFSNGARNPSMIGLPSIDSPGEFRYMEFFINYNRTETAEPPFYKAALPSPSPLHPFPQIFRPRHLHDSCTPSFCPKHASAPPTRISAPASIQSPPFSRSTPPSTIIRKPRPSLRRQSSRAAIRP